MKKKLLNFTYAMLFPKDGSFGREKLNSIRSL